VASTQLDETYVSAQGKTKLKTGATVALPHHCPSCRSGAYRLGSAEHERQHPQLLGLVARLIFRTEFVTHEQVTIQYQYYSYGSWYTSNPVGSLHIPTAQAGNLWVPLQPDRHTFTIAASYVW